MTLTIVWPHGRTYHAYGLTQLEVNRVLMQILAYDPTLHLQARVEDE